MIRRYLDENIYYVENVVSDINLEILNKFCRDENNWATVQEIYKEHIWWNNYKQVTNDSIAYKALQEVNSSIFDITKDGDIEYWTNSVVGRFKDSDPIVENNEAQFGNSEEWSMLPHYDRHSYKGEGSALTGVNVHSCSVLYLNDDFEGGELVYPYKGITIKPKPGLLVVHSGSEDYIHGVKKVTKGIRYSISGCLFDSSRVY